MNHFFIICDKTLTHGDERSIRSTSMVPLTGAVSLSFAAADGMSISGNLFDPELSQS